MHAFFSSSPDPTSRLYLPTQSHKDITNKLFYTPNTSPFKHHLQHTSFLHKHQCSHYYFTNTQTVASSNTHAPFPTHILPLTHTGCASNAHAQLYSEFTTHFFLPHNLALSHAHKQDCRTLMCLFQRGELIYSTW